MDGFTSAVFGGTDCDDTSPEIYPGAPDEWYDGVDADCAEDDDYDADGDGYVTDLYGGSDCDDMSPETYPGAPDEWYDGVDADCAGDDDYDADGDGYASDMHGGTDCDDADPAIHLGETDIPGDDIDQVAMIRCSGIVQSVLVYQTEGGGPQIYKWDQETGDYVTWHSTQANDATAIQMREAHRLCRRPRQ